MSKELIALAAALALSFSPAPAADSKPATSRRLFTLDQAVQTALRDNAEIRKALQEIRRTRGLIVEIRAQALPRLALRTAYDQQDRALFKPRGAKPAPSSPSLDLGEIPASPTGAPAVIVLPVATSAERQILDKAWNVSLEVRQLLYSGGQVRSALKIAKFSEDSAYFTLRDTVERTVFTVRQQFYNIVLSKALIQVREEALRLAEEQVKDQQSRFEAGTVPRFNVLRAEVEAANIRPELIRAKNAFRISTWRLAKTLGLTFVESRAADLPLEAVGDLGTVSKPGDLVAAVQLAKAERAFLKVQRLSILSAAEQIKLELAGYKPRLDATGGLTARNSSVSDNLDDTVHGWFFGVAGSWNIFDGLETRGRVMQARAALEQARILYEDSVRQVELEVQEAFANVLEGIELIESQEKNVEQAQEALRLANERFNAGAGTQLEILDARTALTAAQTNVLEARYTYYVARADLDRATGAATRFEQPFDDPLVRSLHPKDPTTLPLPPNKK